MIKKREKDEILGILSSHIYFPIISDNGCPHTRQEASIVLLYSILHCYCVVCAACTDLVLRLLLWWLCGCYCDGCAAAVVLVERLLLWWLWGCCCVGGAAACVKFFGCCLDDWNAAAGQLCYCCVLVVCLLLRWLCCYCCVDCADVGLLVVLLLLRWWWCSCCHEGIAVAFLVVVSRLLLW